MINEYTCKKCGTKFRRLDYPKFKDAMVAIGEHTKTCHGLQRFKKGGN